MMLLPLLCAALLGPAVGQFSYYYYSYPISFVQPVTITYATQYYTPVYVTSAVSAYYFTSPAYVYYWGLYAGSAIVKVSLISNVSKADADAQADDFTSRLGKDLDGFLNAGAVTPEGQKLFEQLPMTAFSTSKNDPVPPPRAVATSDDNGSASLTVILVSSLFIVAVATVTVAFAMVRARRTSSPTTNYDAVDCDADYVAW